MNLHSLSLKVLYALAIAHIECLSLSSDPNQSALQHQEPTQQQEQQQQQQQEPKTDEKPPPKEVALHPTLTCIVCSTMDYQNKIDNACRSGGPTSSSNNNYNINHSRNNNNLPLTRPDHHRRATLSTTTLINYADSSSATDSSTSTEDNNSNNNIETFVNGLRNATTTRMLKSMQMNILKSGSNKEKQVRTRRCYEDESFCSVVSVARIDYPEEIVRAKFWALERNCSKGCINGCMLIGEKFRLKICSRCCKDPNCNVANDTTTSSAMQNVPQTSIIPFMLALKFIIRFSIMSDRVGVFSKIKVG